MTFHDLERALTPALADGAVGVPVSIRCFLETDAGGDPESCLAAVLPRLASILKATTGRLVAQRHASGGQLNALVTFDDGRTLSASAARGAVPSIRLLVVGNRGIVTLHGGELEGGLRPIDDSTNQRWRAVIAASAAARAAERFS